MKNSSQQKSFARNYFYNLAALAIIIFGCVCFIASCSSGDAPEKSNSNANAAPVNANVGSNTVNSTAAVGSSPATATNTATAATINSATNTAITNSREPVTEANAATADDPDMPSESEVQTLVKTTLLDFNSAIQSGSFESFHSSASADFQQQFTPSQLEQKYAEFVQKKFDFSQIAGKQAVITPKLEFRNGIKILTADGYYPTNPQINFELQYIQEDIEWKLLAINVYLK